MDWLTFIAQVVQAIAWPTTIVLVITILKKPISTLLSELVRLKWKDLEVEFERKMKEVQKQIDQTLPPLREIESSDTISLGLEERTDRFSRLVELSPPAAILEAWLGLETALREIAARVGIHETSRVSPMILVKSLVKKERIDPATASIIENLRGLRNDVVHARSTELTVSQAEEFRKVTQRLIRKLETT